MEKVELMQIEDSFMIDSIGLILIPSFDLPPEGNWKNITEEVTIRNLEGVEITAEALFSIAHLNIKDPTVNVSKRWPILISLRGICKELVPVGSTIFVSKSTREAVTGQNV